MIGFVDHPKGCGFKFKLTRGDGIVLTDSGAYGVSFIVKNSAGTTIAVTPVYSSIDQYWSLSLPAGPVDPNGYWVSYSCTDGIATQYPYRYKSANKTKTVDLIKPGSYLDTIPYWHVVSYENPAPAGQIAFPTSWVGEPASILRIIDPYYYRLALPRNAIYQKGITINSSVPYKVTAGHVYVGQSATNMWWGWPSSNFAFYVGLGAAAYGSNTPTYGSIANDISSSLLRVQYPDGYEITPYFIEGSSLPNREETYGFGVRTHAFTLTINAAVFDGWVPHGGNNPPFYDGEAAYWAYGVYPAQFGVTASYDF